MMDSDAGAEAVAPVVVQRIGIQAGHWRAAEAPDELAGIRSNGTSAGGHAEWRVNLDIAERTARLLEEAGYEVDVLPATVPPGYRADLFISIHADGSTDTRISGYRSAAPRNDRTGRSAAFAQHVDRVYGEVTGMRYYPVITRRMTNYYAFNSRRFDHAIHPETVAIIIETGFLTNPGDRSVLVNSADLIATALARAVTSYGEIVAATGWPTAPVPPEPQSNRRRG